MDERESDEQWRENIREERTLDEEQEPREAEEGGPFCGVIAFTEGQGVRSNSCLCCN